jgi:trehalose-6-phosphate synthase
MLLPQMLREKLPDAAIGFFLHIPFPSSEIFPVLPRREELLEGLIGADLLAFQTHGHLQHTPCSQGGGGTSLGSRKRRTPGVQRRTDKAGLAPGGTFDSNFLPTRPSAARIFNLAGQSAPPTSFSRLTGP